MGFYKRYTIMTWLVCLLPLVLGVASAFGIRPLQVGATDQVLAERNWTAFDQKSGLVGRVSDLFEDRDGNIWLATSAGVQRYDGYSWTTYTGDESLNIDLVNVISQGADGAMWFGVGQPAQLLRYDGVAWDAFGLKDSLAAQTGYAALLSARDGSGDSNGAVCQCSRSRIRTWRFTEGNFRSTEYFDASRADRSDLCLLRDGPARSCESSSALGQWRLSVSISLPCRHGRG